MQRKVEKHIRKNFLGTVFIEKTVSRFRRQVSLKKIFEIQICLSVCLFGSRPVCLSTCLRPCLSVCFFVFLCHSGLVPLCISASLSLNIFLPLWFVYFVDLFFFLWFFHPCLFPSFSMLFMVLVLFLQTVSASLLTLRCFFNFFNQIFGLLLFHVLLFSVVCCFYIDTVTMEVSRHHPSNHAPHRVWSNRSRSLKKLQTSFSKAAYSTLKWKKKKIWDPHPRWCCANCFLLSLLHPFVPDAPFLYPLETSENSKLFWCSQGVEKGWMGTNGLRNCKYVLQAWGDEMIINPF